jgi:intergrase/recombinase
VLRPGFGPGSPARKDLLLEKKLHQETDYLNWLEIEVQLEQWLQSEDYSEYFKKDVLSYLRRYVTEIREPLDIISIFSRIKRGKRHLVLALRTLFNFYEAIGVSKDYLDYLRGALPKVVCGIDLKIPSEENIAESLKKLPKAPLKYQALYNLLIDSGLRLVEAVELINCFKKAEIVNGFCR